MRLINYISQFRHLDVEHVQMDFIRMNGQILAQTYKYKEIKKWRPELDFGENDGYIIELYFTNGKTNNEENYRRFCFSDYYSWFKKFDGIEPKGAYFCYLSSEISDEYFEEVLGSILYTIYGSKTQIEVRVRS